MFKTPGYLSGFSSRADGSAGLRFATQELPLGSFDVLHKLNGQFGWLLFSENEIQDEEIPTEDAEEGKKRPSVRLRAALFVLWTQTGKPGDFEGFYRERMDKLITFVIDKLD
jgi:hypothetical protein